tara:strand:- start:149 stop:325 length:177 start_codon:yes stop_codon:yes gene_type:complete
MATRASIRMATRASIRIELLATIDEINQYLEGNVTKTGLQITLSELINKLKNGNKSIN